ncbi:MAG: S-layer homology domain-containing protein [Oscillospiraceae bacterium]
MEVGGGTEGTAQPSVVYGTYDESGTKWTQKTGLTADGIPYENSATGANVKYSKTAVSKGNDVYDITLKIESETSSTAPGASAVVLVMDISTSMYYCTECGNYYNWLGDATDYHKSDCSRSKSPENRHGSIVLNNEMRLYAAKNAADNFVNSYKGNVENAGRYIQLVAFDGNAYIKLSDWIDVSVAANATKAIAAINGLTPPREGNGTNLEQGLSKAKNLITSAPNGIAKDKKFAVVLTDGEPNRQGSDSSSRKIKSKTDAAAENLKSVASVYTVCFGAESTWSDELKMYVGQYLSGTVASNPSNAFNANSAAELNKAFEKIFKSIEQGLSSGFTVTDPMGKYIQLDESSITGNGASVKNGTITWTPTTGKVSEKDGVKTYTYTLTYTVKLDTSDKDFVDNKYYPTNDVTTLAFKDGDDNITRDFNVPGVKGTAPRYKVTYEYTGTVPTGAPALPGEASCKAGDTVKVAAAPTLNGYTFSGWTTSDATVGSDGSFTMPSNKVTLTGSWTLRSDLSYTVHYYWNGTNDKVAEDKTVDGKTFNETVTEKPATVPGYTPVSADSKTITIRTGTNEITFYYYKNVTLTAEDRIVTYNGQEQTVNTGYDVVVKADNGKDFKLSGVDFKGVHASGTGKEVGKYDIDFVGETVGKTDTTAKYIVANTVKGTLTITPIDTVVVTITGNTDTKVYNGAEQSVTGYTVKISDPKYTEADFKFTGDPKASRTDVGTTPMGLNTDQFENNNKNFKNVTFVVEDGSLTITKRPLTIEGQSSEPITYDGQTHSFMKWWPVTPTDNTGLVSGHEVSGINYLLTGKDAGSYTGKFSGDAKIMSGEENVTENYSIEYTLGKMKIVPAERIAVKIIGNHKEVWYNGQEQSVSGFTFDVADNTVTVELKDGHYAIAKGTNVKTYYMGLKSDDFTINHKNYKEVSAEIVDGYLTIKRHYTPNPPITDKITVEITGNSDSVVYDGTEHSVKDYTVKISDSRYTEKDFTFSGKALASGVNAGAYEMGLKADQFKNTNARFTNVEFIIKADGVLTITQRPLTITAGSAEGIAPVTCDKYTVEGLATGDKVDSVKITGIQSEPGESPNVASDAVIKNAKGEDVTANYKITYVDGVLKAIEVLNKEIHFNYVIGYTDGTIRPNNDISRAEVATIFFRLLTDEAREQYTTTAGNFTDVKAGMWCNRAIATLTNMGIIKGYTDGSFQPNKSITRAELATIIARFAKLDVNTKTFSDINGHWAQKNIELAAGNGWINGYEDGTFRPNNNITRAETFAMINRVLDRQTESVSDLLPTSEMNMWSDNLNENAWYYKDVQEATNYHKCDRVGDSVYEKWTEKVPDIDWASYQI